MPGSKEIRTKIKSVQNTRKITKAMEMVAASKMRKAQERMRAARPYGEKIRNVAAHISHANPEYRHPFLIRRDTVKKVGIIIITTDKGLCGGLNTNVQRLAMNKMKEWEAQGETFEVCCIGNKGLGFMQRLGANIVSQVTGLGDRPQIEPVPGVDATAADRVPLLPLDGTRLPRECRLVEHGTSGQQDAVHGNDLARAHEQPVPRAERLDGDLLEGPVDVAVGGSWGAREEGGELPVGTPLGEVLEGAPRREHERDDRTQIGRAHV